MPPKQAKYRYLEIPREFDLTAGQGLKIIQYHRSWCQWKAHM